MKKKILVFHYARSYGGGDVFLESLLPELAPKYDLVLATVYPEHISAKLRDRNIVIPVYRIPLKNPLLLFGIFSFWSLLSKEKIDLVFVQDIALSLYVRFFQLFDRSLQQVLEITANFRHFKYKLPLARTLVSFFNRISQRQVAKFVCVSDYLVAALKIEGVAPSLIELIYNGVPVCDALSRPPGQKFRVGFIGRLSYEKGIDIYLEIAQKYQDRQDLAEFHVFGDGPMAGLVRQAEQQFPGLVIYHGFVKDVLRQHDLDLVIMPSRDEGLPYTALECMAYGIPLLAASAGGLPDLIKDGENGLLCRIGDVDGFACSLDRLAAEPGLRLALAERAGESVCNKFSLEKMLSSYERLFKDLLSLSQLS
ncbi:MAG: glycosyltransferase family 4 protein [Candidatus Saganbacteria bacterium]|nr:glycosyltransferase family 4 protein [Candidatus Saganbacteria bacterium]